MDVASLLTCFEAQGPALLKHLQKRKKGETQPLQSRQQLRQHQIDAVLQLVKYFNSNDRNTGENIALVVLPTGCGKTGVAVLASYVLSPVRVLVITPSMIISEQIDDAYKHFLVNCGIISGEQKKTNGVLPSIETIRSTLQMFRESGACHEPTTNVVIVNPHKIGGQSRVQIEMIDPKDYDLVIVDEAHHYPAQTWWRIIKRFSKCKRLFLTATPCHNGKPLDITPCFTLEYENAVKDSIIRGLDDLYEVPPHDEKNLDEIYKLVAKGMKSQLNKHDEKDDRLKHQGMVLAQTREGAEKFCGIYNDCGGNECALYVGKSNKNVLQQFFSGRFRILVVVGRLQEGFDHNRVSVVGIIRKVKSRVLFTQFVGRAVRKSAIDDRVKAQIVTHRYFEQQSNYNMFDKLATTDPELEDVENPSDVPMENGNNNFMEASGNSMENSKDSDKPVEKDNGNFREEKDGDNLMEDSDNPIEKDSDNPMEKDNDNPMEKDSDNPLDSTEQ